MPATKPSTTVLATRSRLEMLWSTAGSRNRCTLGAGRCGNLFEQAAQNLVGLDAVRFGVEVEQDAMAQDGDGHRDDVFFGYVVAAAGEGARFGRQHNELRGANAGAVVDVFFYEIGGAA